MKGDLPVSDHRHVDPEQDMNKSEGVFLRWNGKSFGARGVAVYFVLAVLAIIASNLFTGWQTKTAVTDAISAIAQATAKEHQKLQSGQERTSCVLSMTVEDRVKFRNDYAPGAFKKWCPWVDE